MPTPSAIRLFRNAHLPDGRCLDLKVCDGVFADAADQAAVTEVVDLTGFTVLPAFVEGHIHLDKSFVGDVWHPHVPAETLPERLAIEKGLLANALPVIDRAEALLAQAHGLGTVAMRSHVDIDPVIGLANLHAVVTACERWHGRVNVQLVAFPQAGILASPGTADLLDAAMGEGATVVGGLDPSTFDGDPDAHLDVVFGVAARHGAPVDIHLHEPGACGINQLRRIAARTSATGMSGKVTVSHAYALGEIDRDEMLRTADVLADAGVSIMTNAPGNRPFPPIMALRKAGVRIFAGNDNVRDAWWPYGDADMLRRANMIGYRSGFWTDADLSVALEMATTVAADVLGLTDYGIAPGKEATFVIVDTDKAVAAVAAPPDRRRLVQRGVMMPLAPSRLTDIPVQSIV